MRQGFGFVCEVQNACFCGAVSSAVTAALPHLLHLLLLLLHQLLLLYSEAE